MSKLNAQQELFVDVFIEETIVNGTEYFTAARKAKEAAGYAPSIHAYHFLNNSRIAEEITKRCQQIMAMQLPKTVRKVESVLDDPTQAGSRRILEAAAMIMDRAGLVKKDVTELEIKAPDGVVLLPAKNKE